MGDRVNNEFKLILQTGNEIMKTRKKNINPEYFFKKNVSHF